MTATPTDAKWTQSGLGPRQAKAVNEAFSKFSWAAKTVREITDHGQFDSVAMFGGSWSETARESMDAIRDKYSLTVTQDNHKELIADLVAATKSCAANPRTVDKRSTPEERAAREVARKEREEAQRVEAERLATFTHHEYSVAETAAAIKRILRVIYPLTKFSVTSDTYSGGCSIDAHWTDGPTERQIHDIMDRFAESDFDGMQDLKTSRSAAEWQSHRFKFHGDFPRGSRRHSAEFLLECCERFSAETGLASPEVTSSGEYAYVDRGDGRACGYSFHTSQPGEYPAGVICSDPTGHWTACDIVNQIAHHTSKESPAAEPTRDTVFGLLLGEAQPEAGGSPAAPLGSGDVTVSRNEAKGGIELRFAQKPDRATLDSLKARGWRWSKFSSCWWIKYSESAWEFAQKVAGVSNA